MLGTESVGIIILNYNGGNDTVNAIRSVLNLDYEHWSLCVVDNASSDDSYKQIINYLESGLFVDNVPEELDNTISRDHDGVGFYFDGNEYICNKGNRIKLIRSESNGGFSSGNNIGIDYVINDVEYIWLLNNDVLLERSSLSELVAYQNDLDVDIGIVSNKIKYFDDRNKIQACGGIYNKYFATTKHLGDGEIDRGQYDHHKVVDKIDYPVGASMFVKKKFVESVGKLSEDYFLYFEELDWIKRGMNKGWGLGYCWKAEIYHKQGASIGTFNTNIKSEIAEKYTFRNRVLFTSKFYRRYLCIVKLGMIISGFIRIGRGSFSSLQYIRDAMRLK